MCDQHIWILWSCWVLLTCLWFSQIQGSQEQKEQRMWYYLGCRVWPRNPTLSRRNDSCLWASRRLFFDTLEWDILSFNLKWTSFIDHYYGNKWAKLQGFEHAVLCLSGVSCLFGSTLPRRLKHGALNIRFALQIWFHVAFMIPTTCWVGLKKPFCGHIIKHLIFAMSIQPHGVY